MIFWKNILNEVGLFNEDTALQRKTFDKSVNKKCLLFKVVFVLFIQVN